MAKGIDLYVKIEEAQKKVRVFNPFNLTAPIENISFRFVSFRFVSDLPNDTD